MQAINELGGQAAAAHIKPATCGMQKQDGS
jgi:hypothetical protein